MVSKKKAAAATSPASRPAQGEGARVLVIEARFYEEIADALAEGALAAIAAAGATAERMAVPGALEIPQALALACSAGLVGIGSTRRFDGAVALGCVIRGETSHYDTVCDNANHWLMQVALHHGVPVGNGILTVENEAQAWARAKGGIDNKGGDAARACLALIEHQRAMARLG
jgi:6,7-dimethyl-8-ribityllumazine synthase